MASTLYAKPNYYAYPLISWSSVIAGAVVALTLGAGLSLLGVAIGATAFNPFDIGGAQDKALTIGGGVWVVFSAVVSMQVGGFIAARTARWPDHAMGAFQGLCVWAVSFAVIIYVLGSGVGALTHANPGNVNPMVAAATRTTADAVALDRGAVQGRAADQATDTVKGGKDLTATLAWWAVATMALGAVGAIAGGRLGARHPTWANRPIITHHAVGVIP